MSISAPLMVGVTGVMLGDGVDQTTANSSRVEDCSGQASCSTYSIPVKHVPLSDFHYGVMTFGPLPDHRHVANETEYNVAVLIWRVCPVILFLFGTIGNIIILFMMRTLRLGRTCMHVYLRTLAISDLCVLYTGLLRWWVLWSFGIDLRNLHTVLCKVHTWMVYVTLYVSAWLLVFMTLERTCSACLPHRVNMFCTKRRACTLIVFIVVFQFCMQSHFLFGLELGYTSDNVTHVCQAVTGEYNYFLHNIYPIVDLVLLSLIPFALVILGNIVIIWKTFLSLKTAAELNLTSNKSVNLRRRRASSMTVILICLSALFLLTTSPTCVFNMWERTESARTALTTSAGIAHFELAWALVSIIMYCNNTFNFYLYCLSGRKFRNEIWRQLSRRRTDSQSIVFSAPSMQLHRYPLKETRQYFGRENGLDFVKDTQIFSDCQKNRENVNGFFLPVDSDYPRNENAYL